ncbi:MAG: hypothetical protein NC936_01745 [Candidatus Omnitrophica bacterium]|nr:hypothetical protein [Candidatus Omnitrophota bacterium]
MNKITISICIFVVIFCVASFAYLNNKQEKKAAQIESDVFKRFELWTKSYDSLKQELESRKQARDFLMQQQYNRELENFIKAQIGNFARQQQEFRQEFLGLLQQQKDTYDNFSLDIAGQVNEQKKQLLEYKVKNDKMLEEYFLEIKQALAGLRQEFAENKNQLSDYKKRLEEVEIKAQEQNKLLQDYKQRLLEYEKKLNDYAGPAESPAL